MEQFNRTEMLLGKNALEKLSYSTVAVFGIGGIGSFAAEALARSGIGTLVLCDKDVVDVTNINRQSIAFHSTLGQPKVEMMAKRIADINPQAKVICYQHFYGDDTKHLFHMNEYDYVVDAIDTISSKITLIEEAKAAGIPVISSMGAGNKLDPKKFEVADIEKTSVCPLAKAVRGELRKKGIRDVKVVYSKEIPVKVPVDGKSEKAENRVVGSVAFVPSVAGLILAGEVVLDLIRE